MIHETAIIDNGATLGKDVKIGPYCVVGSKVTLGDRVELKSHVVIDGITTIGEDTIIYPFASIGSEPQDLKFGGEESELIIGKRNKIREHATMNPGTVGDNLKTIIGDDCLFMVGTHVAHDCVVGNQVIMANNATIAGHVHVGDGAILGGLSAVRQFVRIGQFAMIGGMSGVESDVIPYGLVKGERANLDGLNYIGLSRRGFSKDEVKDLVNVYNELFDENGTLNDRVSKVANNHKDNANVMNVLDFISSRGKLSICQPKMTG